MVDSLPISAIICTHNRDQYLGAAIDSLLAQDAPSYEVIVIDNASSDRTKEVTEARLPHPRLQYVHEAQVGLSVARNTGARVAQGEILAYLDDDAVATPGWLSALLAGFQANEKLAIAGGKVTLLWPPGVTSPPPWLSDGLAGNLGAYDLGPEITPITNPIYTPRGLNYAIRRSFLEQIGGFDPNLGRVGKNLLSNEELQMTELALEQGWQVAYLPAALVAHNVTPDRLQRTWFMRRGWWQGVSEAYREQLAGRAGLVQFSRGGERIVRGLYKSLKYFKDPAIRFDNLVYAYGQIGYLKTAVAGMLLPKPFKS
ncbi:glycosyltransferase family 2 protein [Spirulina subsalsa FACHB-351]|uniref:Glycosyltransferase family 2 protein n=1 Tax=Spirulina subsalsa FACHB-351 TaxID=234711 RepID=A0ABT3L1F6_9CYAN|nr:glycosyltransferase family 2 protein [Spirulina subsalsa]MCW6035311.1 glycosyltransferase family 2 protein [Spirulina subsalsa FACHB-351]